MIKDVGLVFVGVSISMGLGAGIVALFGYFALALMTAWVGSAIACLGFGLIAWSMQPGEAEGEDAAYEDPGEALGVAA